MMFGVIDNSKIVSDSSVPRKWWLTEYGYAYSNGGIFYHDNISEQYYYNVKDGDIVDLWLDLNKYTVSFAHNNTFFINEHKVKDNTNYRMAIGTANAPVIVQLI